MILNTLNELLKFLQENCYNLDQYGINESPKYDGFCIEKWGELYVWSYTERGDKRNLNYFSDEKSAVDFVLNTIVNDKFAKNHLISIVKTESRKDTLVKKLQLRAVNYHIDEIPVIGGMATRFFVIGCDINNVQDLIDLEIK